MMFLLGAHNQIENMRLGTNGRPVLPDHYTMRGHMRSVMTPRYKFSRYFAPQDHHRPESWQDLIDRNDLELFDTASDPEEMVNLAANPEKHRALILRLNDLLNELVDREIGTDKGYGYMGRSWSGE